MKVQALTLEAAATGRATGPATTIKSNVITPFAVWLPKTFESAVAYYKHVLTKSVLGGAANLQAWERALAKNDLFYLLTRVLRRQDLCGTIDGARWFFDRCREVQADPDGHVDLWAREHGKSSVITFGLTILNVINNPEVTVGIFSNTRPLAKKFLLQIKTEFEDNADLKRLFPEIFYDDPKNQSPKWSMDEGIQVKRKGNPREQTVEAWGLLDGMPTGSHFDLRVYDDVVTETTVTVELIPKTTMKFDLSESLGKRGGKFRVIGTRYHLFDTYALMIAPATERTSDGTCGKGWPCRFYPVTKDGTEDGEPWYLTKEEVKEKRRNVGPYVFNCQYLLNPANDNAKNFQVNWIRYYDKDPKGGNIYIICDPARKKDADSDYTSIWVVLWGSDDNWYIIDGLRERLSMTERAQALTRFHQKYAKQGLRAVGYEAVGAQADLEGIALYQETDGYRFPILPLPARLTATGPAQPKSHRIESMIPRFEQGKVWFPRTLIVHAMNDNHAYDLVGIFLREEYQPYPVSKTKDMLDSLAHLSNHALGAHRPATLVSTEDRRERKAFRRRGTSALAG